MQTKLTLSEWCKNNKLDEKIFFADSVTNINRAKRLANKEKVIITNLTGMNMMDKAREIVIENMAQSGRFEEVTTSDDEFGTLMVYNILKEDNSKKYSFVPVESVCMNTAREILRVMNIIRTGKTTEDYEKTTVKKEIQVKNLIEEYEKELEVCHHYDRARYIKEAIDILEKNPTDKHPCVAIFDYMLDKMTYIERRFLELFAKDYVVITTEIQHESAAAFFESYGQVNEIRNVVDDIVKNKYPLGLVNILYSSQEYETAIRAELMGKKIPFAFESEYSILDKSYVQLLMSIIEWYQGGCLYTSYKAVVDNILVRQSIDYVFGKKVGIGWGLERYEMFVDQMENHKDDYLKLLLKYSIVREPKPNADGTVPEIKTCSDDYLSFMKKLIAVIRECENKADATVGYVYRRLIDFIAENTEDFNMEKPYLRQLQGMRAYFDYVKQEGDFSAALRFIKDTIANITCADETEENAITVSKIGRVDILERPYQYIIGLSHDTFEEKVIDSPVIYDARLKVLVDENRGCVEQITERSKEKAENLLKTVQTLKKGTFVISASTYDTRNFRECAVSEVFRKLMEQFGQTKTTEIDYANQITYDHNYKVDKNAVFAEADETGLETPVYGYIQEEEQNGHRIVKLNRLSPTALQGMLECAWKFDYRLKGFENSDIEKNVTVWLTADKRGTLFHEVFEEYFEEKLIGKKIEATDNLDETLLKAIFEKVVYEFEIITPKGSKQAFEIEKDAYYKDIKGYLESLYTEFKADPLQWVIKECEHEYTTEEIYLDKDGNECTAGSCDAVCYSYHGYIDRIDSYIDEEGIEHFRIVDYKTGKTDKLQDKIDGNMQIQHIVYTKALPGDVVYFEYDFPCDANGKIKLQGSQITDMPQEIQEKIANVLVNDDYGEVKDGACDYCDYKDICLHRMNLN